MGFIVWLCETYSFHSIQNIAKILLVIFILSRSSGPGEYIFCRNIHIHYIHTNTYTLAVNLPGRRWLVSTWGFLNWYQSNIILQIHSQHSTAAASTCIKLRYNLLAFSIFCLFPFGWNECVMEQFIWWHRIPFKLIAKTTYILREEKIIMHFSLIKID